MRAPFLQGDPMYGLKRIEYGDYKDIKSIEFYPDVSGVEIRKTLEELNLLPTKIEGSKVQPAIAVQLDQPISSGEKSETI